VGISVQPIPFGGIGNKNDSLGTIKAVVFETRYCGFDVEGVGYPGKGVFFSTDDIAAVASTAR